MSYPARYPAVSITHMIVPRWIETMIPDGSSAYLSGPGYIWFNARDGDPKFRDDISHHPSFPCGEMLKTAMVMSNYMALI